SRKFRVEGIKEQEITAEYKEGILKVTMPKAEPTIENKTKINID
ncbi:MAG: Hsp20 family protein, partial [Syntrophomonas sp.]